MSAVYVIEFVRVILLVLPAVAYLIFVLCRIGAKACKSSVHACGFGGARNSLHDLNSALNVLSQCQISYRSKVA
jgi:hypothetical protein